jgi:hypothetical protein
MNKLDQLIKTRANALFISQGLSESLAQFKTQELMICVARGYNTRAEILRLISKAGA